MTTVQPPVTAGRRAFFLTFSITQRDSFRRDRRGATGLEVVLGEVPVDAAGEQRGRGGKISADQALALCGRRVSSARGTGGGSCRAICSGAVFRDDSDGVGAHVGIGFAVGPYGGCPGNPGHAEREVGVAPG
jgi:hypothetical protein